MGKVIERDVAGIVRERLDVSVESQLACQSASAAFDAWRAGVQDLGVVVFLFQLGAESCRGFSLWDDRAPIVAVNTAWNDEARAFTLFHEFGHLITRTNSACVSAPPAAVSGALGSGRTVVRTLRCRRPRPRRRCASDDCVAPGRAARVTDLATVRWLAGKFRASLRAVTLRLIELNLSHWDLYRELPAAGDAKRGGGGGKGRDRREIQEDQLGGAPRATFAFRACRSARCSSSRTSRSSDSRFRPERRALRPGRDSHPGTQHVDRPTDIEGHVFGTRCRRGWTGHGTGHRETCRCWP
jgi:hypothetical protein